MAEDDVQRARGAKGLLRGITASVLALARWITSQVRDWVRRRRAQEGMKVTINAAIVFVGCAILLLFYHHQANRLGMTPASKATLFASVTGLASAVLWMDAAWNSKDRASNWAAAVYSAATAFFAAAGASFQPGQEQLAIQWQGMNYLPALALVGLLAGAGLVRLARWRSRPTPAPIGRQSS